MTRDSTCGFPAHAGMDLHITFFNSIPIRLPRTRGDGPVINRGGTNRFRASPHTRGWTVTCMGSSQWGKGFPAHAGMDLGRTPMHVRSSRLPRTRGDGPKRSGCASGGRGASPHTRGWTQHAPHQPRTRKGFPAHAGMDPRVVDGPVDHQRLPRTRGDGPWSQAAAWRRWRASPHTRGWTPGQVVAGLVEEGFPAHAGMDPAGGRWAARRSGLPRTRGDGPRPDRRDRHRRWASPHTRGWTRMPREVHPHRPGFPAHAGMDHARQRSAGH